MGDSNPPEGEELSIFGPNPYVLIRDTARNAIRQLFGKNNTDPCQETVLADGTSLNVMAIFAVAMLLILTLMEKRNEKFPNCCGGHGGMLLSVNFLENKTSRDMIVAAFVFTASDLWRFIATFDAQAKGRPPFLAALFKLLMVMAFSITYIPVFNCITVNTFFRQFLGFSYIVTSTCLSLTESTSICNVSKLNSELLSYQIIKYVTLICSGGYLALKFLYRMVKIAGEFRDPSPPSYVHPYQVLYIKNVLNPTIKTKTKTEAVTFKEKFSWAVHKLSYHCVPGFRYSISILISIAVGLLIYVLLIRKTLAKSTDTYHYLTRTLEANRNILSDQMPNVFLLLVKAVSKSLSHKNVTDEEMDNDINSSTTSLFEIVDDQVDCIFGSLFLAISLSSIQVGLTVLLMLKTYRKNLLRMYRQEVNEEMMSAKHFNHVALVISAIQFTGYQVAHMVWGYGLQAFVFFLLFIVIGEVIILPLKAGYWGVIELIFNKFGPIILIILITMLVQRILVKSVFLVEKGSVFGIDNRKAFYNFMFFMFYYNVLTGMITCIVRVLKATLLGVWFFPRLDMSIFPRLTERFDTGYKAYVCLLALEQLQSNIILDTFFQLLIESCKKLPEAQQCRKRPIMSSRIASSRFPNDGRGHPILRSNYAWTAENFALVRDVPHKLGDTFPIARSKNLHNLGDTFPIASKTLKLPSTYVVKDKRARNRWFLAWTLIHNPSIQHLRRWIKPIRKSRF